MRLKSIIKYVSCSICEKEIDQLFSYYAKPVNDGKCCEECNSTIVRKAKYSNFFNPK